MDVRKSLVSLLSVCVLSRSAGYQEYREQQQHFPLRGWYWEDHPLQSGHPGLLCSRTRGHWREYTIANWHAVLTRAVDPDPHSFSLLDPDPGGKNLKITTGKLKNARNCNLIFLKEILPSSMVFYLILFLFLYTTEQFSQGFFTSFF